MFAEYTMCPRIKVRNLKVGGLAITKSSERVPKVPYL